MAFFEIESRISTNDIARQKKDFVDLDLDFIPHPSTGDLVKKRGIDAIKRAMRNLVYLHRGEIGFSPQKGAGIWHALFQPYTPATVTIIQQELYNLFKAYEPRVDIYEIFVEEDVSRNGINISIHFYIINFSEPVTLNLFLERVR